MLYSPAAAAVAQSPLSDPGILSATLPSRFPASVALLSNLPFFSVTDVDSDWFEELVVVRAVEIFPHIRRLVE